MKLEDLPGELWFVILSYLSPLEAFYAFHQLFHARIQSILFEMYSIERDDYHCSSILNLSLVHLPLSMYQFALSNILTFYSNVLHSLTLSNQRTPGQIEDFFKKYSFKYDFPYLKSLRLIEPTSNELNVIINDLASIDKLHIQSKDMHRFDLDTLQKILYGKLNLSHCSFSQFREDFIRMDQCSTIRSLSIDACDYQCFIQILNHFSSLEFLCIHTLTMSRKNLTSSMDMIDHSLLIRQLKLRAFSIPWNYLQMIFPYLENLQRFSLAIFCDEGFDYVNSDQWQLVIQTYWSQLKQFQLYSELWYLTSIDCDEIYPQLLAFENDIFWLERQLTFRSDFYQDADSLHCIFYSIPYLDQKFSNQWGYPIELNRSHNFISKNAYRNVNRLLLTIYNNKQMQIDLEKSSRYFPSIETLTIRFEQSVSSYLMGLYINQLMNVNSIKHLVLNERGHTISTLAELLQRLPNVIQLTISSNHRMLVKQIFQKRNAQLLSQLSERIIHLNLLYDGVMSYGTIEAIRFHFLRLKSLTACLPHFEDFRDTIPAIIRQMKSLQYLHIALECDNDKKNFTTQDMYDWFRRHYISQELHLAIDTYTNSIHIWL